MRESRRIFSKKIVKRDLRAEKEEQRRNPKDAKKRGMQGGRERENQEEKKPVGSLK